MDYEEALQLITAVQAGQFEDSLVEAKAAQRRLPRRIYESLSAFANRTAGGVIILGLDEEHGFAPTGIVDVQTTIAQLADEAGRMVPPLRLEHVVVQVGDKQVVVVEVPECPYDQKPCFLERAGINSGSYIRVGNTNRRMTSYEVFSYVSNRSQPIADRGPVTQASIEDLDSQRLSEYLSSLRSVRAELWQRMRLDEQSSEQQLCTLGVLTPAGETFHPTLAALLSFGKWPQRLFPSLVVTFVRYPGQTKDERGPRGERFLDNVKCEGPLPDVVAEVLQRISANMRQSVLVEGIFHRMLSEYPTEAIREAVVNAVVHRDYSPMARSSPVRVEMYTDRLLVQSPGGLYGPVNEQNLEEAQSTRNLLLMRFLEDLRLVENRGSGIRAMVAAMREARLEPPQFRDTRNFFHVVFKNTSLMTPEALEWLSQFSGYRLNDSQRTALLYLRYNKQMANSDYRRLNNVNDTVLATRELRELVDCGLVTMQSTRRWATYVLSERPEQIPVRPVLDEELGEEEEKILEYVRRNGSITRGECAAVLGDTPRRCGYLLARLRKQGRLEAVGRKRGTRYVLR